MSEAISFTPINGGTAAFAAAGPAEHSGSSRLVPPVVLQVVYQITQQPQLLYAGPGQQFATPASEHAPDAPFHTYVVPAAEHPSLPGQVVPAHTITVPNPALLRPSRDVDSASTVAAPYGSVAAPAQSNVLRGPDSNAATPWQHQQQQNTPWILTTATGTQSYGRAVQQAYVPPPPAVRWRASKASGVFSLLVLIPALLMTTASLGQDVYRPYDGPYNQPATPMVLLWDVESCTKLTTARYDCTRLSFDDAVNAKLLSSRCASGVRSTSAMVVMSMLVLIGTIVLAAFEAGGSERFAFSVPAGCIVSLVFTGLAFGLPVGGLDRRLCPSYAIGAAVGLNIGSHVLVWLACVGYVPRLCGWGCCHAAADMDEQQHGSAPDVATKRRNGSIILFIMVNVALVIAAMAAPVDTLGSDVALRLWGVDDCTTVDGCTTVAIMDRTSTQCASHVYSAAGFTVVALIALVMAFVAMTLEICDCKVHYYAPLCGLLFACVSEWAAFGLLSTALTRPYCAPFGGSLGVGEGLLAAGGSILLFSPFFFARGLFRCVLCDCIPPAPDTVIRPDGGAVVQGVEMRDVVPVEGEPRRDGDAGTAMM